MLYVYMNVDGKASAYLIQFFYSLAIPECRSLFVPASTTLQESPTKSSPSPPASTNTPTAFIRFRKYFPR